MRRHVTLMLALLCVLLALALAAMWFDSNGRLRNASWQPPEPRQPDFAGIAPALPSQAPAEASQFVAILERPLFSPNRRPPPVATAVAPTAAPPPPPVDPLANVQLLGLYSGKGSGGIIAKVDGKARRLALKERIGDWTISSIEQREVTLTRSGETRVLTLSSKPVHPPDQPAPLQIRGSTAPPQPPAPANASTDPAPSVQQQMQEHERARLARRNALRAKAGLPPVPE